MYYPAWLAYACAYVEKHGFTARLIDRVADKMEFSDSVSAATAHAPKLVVISTSTPSIEADAKFARADGPTVVSAAR